MKSSSMQAQRDETKVLVIYTGGTIGMLVGGDGYAPEQFFLTEILRSQSRFHDPLGESLFNSHSVEGYRNWSSGRSSPVTTTFHGRETSPSGHTQRQSSLVVRSSRPISSPPNRDAAGPASLFAPYVSKQVSENCYEMALPSLVTPQASDTHSNSKRIRYAVLEWQPLLDSSNLDIDDWIRIATEIELNYSHFEGFVILHGTDTMSYTSSALSFLLEDLGKTVILTGAQIPLAQLRNDAIENLLGALWIAGHYVIPEVSLFFNHTLYRGNRVSKISSFDLNAFHSPNFSPLVNVGIDVVVNWNLVLRQTSVRKFHAHKAMSANVATLRLFPGITAATVRAFLTPPINGVVLETFGSGNAPQRDDLMSALKEACDRGVVIVAITQCSKGSVSSAYETGQALLHTGVVPGGDMTPECALAKLAYLLSKPKLTRQEIRNLIQVPLRGELTLPAGSIADNTISTSDAVQDLVSHVIRLQLAPSKPDSSIPLITLDESSKTATAPWSFTASEAISTEAALFPFLIHLAVSRDDIDGLNFCLNSDRVEATPSADSKRTVAGGIVNSLDPSSGMTPLHVAALNGSVRCVSLLLEAGALVHMRDLLDHSPLYYAARQGHEAIVDILVKAGALLGGSDISGGFASLAVKKALRIGDETLVKVWRKAGFELDAPQQGL